MAVTSKRPGRQLVSVIPQLSVRGGLAALEFYRVAFGAEVVYQVGGTAENPSVVAQLSVGGAPFWVADESPEHGNFSPESVGGSTTRMLLIVDDQQHPGRRPADRLRAEVAVFRRLVGNPERRPADRQLGDDARVLGRASDLVGDLGAERDPVELKRRQPAAHRQLRDDAHELPSG